MLKHLGMPKDLLATLVEQLPMQFSREMGHCFLDFGPLRCEAGEVSLYTQKSSGHLSGAALRAGLKRDDPLLPGLLGL